MTTETLKELLQDRQFWLNFIKEYKALPVLWQELHPQFTSKKCRDQALQSLTKKVRVRWPEANVEFVKQRISNFRRTFLNEYEKVKESKGSKTIYTPSLYYYNHLLFLKEGDLFEKGILDKNIIKSTPKAAEKRTSTKTIEYTTKPNEKRQISIDECATLFKADSQNTEQEPKRLKVIKLNKSKDDDVSIIFDNFNYDVEHENDEEFLDNEPKSENEILQEDYSAELAEPHTVAFVSKQNDFEQDQDLHVTEDEFDEIAKRVATHFRKMDPEQCLLAEKLIFDICIGGRLKRLSNNASLNY